MANRRVGRINYNYLDKLFAALDKLGIDPRELPREFARMAWEDKLEWISTRYNVSYCTRCKLPRREEEMDPRYSLCRECASSLHRKPGRDPRVAQMLLNHAAGFLDTSAIEALRKTATPGAPVDSAVQDILDRASKRG